MRCYFPASWQLQKYIRSLRISVVLRIHMGYDHPFRQSDKFGQNTDKTITEEKWLKRTREQEKNLQAYEHIGKS